MSLRIQGITPKQLRELEEKIEKKTRVPRSHPILIPQKDPVDHITRVLENRGHTPKIFEDLEQIINAWRKEIGWTPELETAAEKVKAAYQSSSTAAAAAPRQ